jgi:uncharacterized protein
MPARLSLIAFATLLLAAPAYADTPAEHTISLSGHGEVSTAPDTATTSIGVTNIAPTAKDALAANSAAMTTLIATIKAAGIESRDIQTSGFSVSPQYDYGQRDANGVTPAPRITGYQVQNNVSIKVRKLADLGSLLDKVVGDGANTIDSVSFSVNDPAKLYDEARKAAYADAMHKAKIYADTAGIALGDIVSMSEGSAEMPRPQTHMYRMAAPVAAPAVPVEAGEMTYDIDLSVTWAIKGAGTSSP